MQAGRAPNTATRTPNTGPPKTVTVVPEHRPVHKHRLEHCVPRTLVFPNTFLPNTPEHKPEHMPEYKIKTPGRGN